MAEQARGSGKTYQSMPGLIVAVLLTIILTNILIPEFVQNSVSIR